MKRFTIFVLCFALFVAILAACVPTASTADGTTTTGTQGPHAIVDAYLNDWLFNYEPRANGMVSVWARHDDVGVYCTADKDMQKQLKTITMLSNPHVLIHYRSVNVGDAEYGAFIDLLDQTGCGSEGQNVTTYHLLDVTLFPDASTDATQEPAASQ